VKNKLCSKEDVLGKISEYFEDKSKPSIPLPLSYMEELEIIWGKKWGAQSEIGKLEELLVIRPGEEAAPPERDLAWYQYTFRIDVETAQKEHDGFVEVLKSEGVKVYDLDPPEEWLLKEPYGVPHARFGGGSRDPGFVINGGAIIGRMSLPYRKGEEYIWARKVMELGCPILYTVQGNGTFEGGNVVWLDPEHVCIGKSARTNQEGIDQVSLILKMAGVQEIKVVPIPGWLNYLEWPAGGFAHLDCVFGYLDDGIAVLYPPGVPYDFIEYLREKDVNMIEAPPDEAKDFSCNTVALEPGKIMLATGYNKTQKSMEREGVDVVNFEWTMMKHTGGGAHCATGPLIRRPGPKLE
jgi:N-dimethylarginine dimethylaminohydrolase